MAPSRRQIAGRSPLMNQQRQITSFFGNSASSSSPTPSLSDKKTPKANPNPNPPSPSPPNNTPKSNPPARCPSPGPATPSPVQSKFKKPILVIGQTPSPPKSAEITYGDEVVGKRVRVYWPIDKTWYDGNVISYDKSEGKHVVEYDDGEEESLDLGKEKIEWVIGEKSGVTFKRLRRGASAFRRVVTDDDDDDDGDVEMSNVEDMKEDKSDGDDSNDEDWGKNMGKEVSESEDDVELDDEEEVVEEKDEETPKGKRVSKTESRKRKSSEVAKSGSEKKSRTDKETTLKGFKASIVEPAKKIEEGKLEESLVVET